MEIAQRRAIVGEEQHEASDSRYPSEDTQTSKQASVAESSAKSNCTARITTQNVRKENARQGQPEKEVAKDDTDEEQPQTRLAAEHDEKSTIRGQAQPTTQQDELTVVPGPPAAIESAAGASAAAANDDSASAASVQGSVQASTGKSDAMQCATDARQTLKGALAQPDEASNLAAVDAQQAGTSALLEELGAESLGMAENSMTLLPLTGESSAQSQSCVNTVDGNQPGREVQGSSAAAQTNAGQVAAFDVTNLQGSASGGHSASASVATGGNTDTAHSSSTANGSSDQAGHRMAADATPAGAGAVHTEIASALQTAAISQHSESRLVGGERAELAETGRTAQDTSAARGLMADQSSGSTLAGMSGISTAQIVQTMRDSEMRVGIHLNEFGAVSIRTTVSDQQMQAQIAVEHSELGSALAAHIPSMQQKLGTDFGLQASIEVNANGSGFTGNGQRASQQQTTVTAMVGTQPQDFTTEMPIAQMSAAADSTYRLDIRA